MPIGKGVVLIGMGERTTRQAVFQVAAAAVRAQGRDARHRLPDAEEPRRDAPRHRVHASATATSSPPSARSSTRSAATARARDGKGGIEVRAGRGAICFDVVKEALGLKELRVVETGGNAWQAQREQWDDGNNVVALEPGVVVAYDRNTHTNTLLRKAGRRGDHDARRRARPRPRRRPLHDLPDLARRRPTEADRSNQGENIMSFNLRNRSLLTVQDYTPREFRYLLDLARDLKRAKYARTEQKHLEGKEICLIFEKTSTRTRCAFEVACYDQGANVTYLDPAGSQIGHKESFKDTARVLGRMFDAIEYRGAGQKRRRDSWPSTPACRSSTA